MAFANAAPLGTPTGLAVCASCGYGMTRTGTRRGDRRYAYYSCAGCEQRGRSVCKGRHVPMHKLDALVLDGMAEQLLVPERMETILGALVERNAARDRSVAERRHRLETELDAIRARISRLYRAIEDGIAELDEDLKERLARLKQERNIAQASLERIATSASARATITPQKISVFTDLMRDRLKNGDIRARKDWLGALITRVEVDDGQIRIVGDKTVLAAALAGQGIPTRGVSGFVRKWCTRQDSNL